MVPPDPPGRGAPGDSPGSTDPLLGALVAGKYRVSEMVARGGMGRIYRAVQEPLGRAVALKVLTPSFSAEDPESLERRFLREAATCASLTHPNTVTVFDYGALTLSGQETFFIVMEFVEGRTLHNEIRRNGPLTATRAIRVAREICRSLREAHQHGIVHRDLKPSNVMLVTRDEGESVKVLDFGVAKVLQAGNETLTHDGSFVGSPRYSAPEQIRGEEVDARADVYALGVVMYEMLSGQPPFARQEAMRTLMAHLQDEVPPLPPRCPTPPPPALETLIMACLEKDRDRRPQSIDAVLTQLDPDGSASVAGNFIAAPRTRPSAPLAAATPPADAVIPSEQRADSGELETISLDDDNSPQRRHWWAFAATGGLLLILALGAGIAALGWSWSQRVVSEVAPPGLAPPEAPATAVPVAIRSTPEGADVTEAGAHLGVTPLELDVFPGTARTVTLRKTGFLSADATLRVGEPVELTLKPIAAAPKPRKPPGRDLDIRTER